MSTTKLTKAAQRRLRRQKLALRFPKQEQLANRQSAPKSTNDYSATVPDPPRTFSKVHTFRSGRHPCSNFYPCKIVLDGTVYNSTEHAYQTIKCLEAGHKKLADLVRDAPTAAKAKLMARHLRVNPETELKWESKRVQVMKRLLECKYQRCASFRNFINGSDLYFVEATMDDFWACGLHRPCGLDINPKHFDGENVLGRLITRLARVKRLE